MGRWRENHKGTSTYFENSAWHSIQKATINGMYPEKHRFSYRKGIRVDMTRVQFGEWCLKMRGVIEGLYRSGEKPFLRRIDSSKNFTVDNIVIGTAKTTNLTIPQRIKLPYRPSRVKVVKSKIKSFLKGLFK